MASKVMRFLRNILDDGVILIATTGCILTVSYWPTVRGIMIDHLPPLKLDWPTWYVIVIAGFIALVLVAVDANTGDAANRKKRFKDRLARHMVMGIGWLGIMEKLLGGGG